MTFDTVWTPEATALLCKLHAKGTHSFAGIVHELNKRGYAHTRNSVIGKAHRLELTNQRLSGRPQKKSKPSVKRSARVVHIHVTAAHTQHAVASPPVEAIANIICCARAVPRSDRTGHLIDLDADQCHWPLGEINDYPPYMFCTADAVPLQPYCAHHRSIAYQPVKSSSR